MNRSKLHVIKPLLLVVSLFALGTSSFSIDLEQGKSRSQVEKQLLKDIYAKHTTLPGFLFEYDSEKYFALSKTGSAIGTYNMTDPNAALHGWSLTRWEHHYFNPEFVAWNKTVAANLTEDGEYWPELFLNTKSKNIGCLSSAPLRYGDVGGDGQDDLVIFFRY